MARAERQRLPQPGGATSVGGYNTEYNAFNLVHGMTFGAGCRCCYDPNADGGEYDLLTAARRARGDAVAAADYENAAANAEAEEEEQEVRRGEDSEDSSDSDDEFDYLLDEGLPGDGGAEPGRCDPLQSERRAELERRARHGEVARHHGYGVHRQMHPRRAFAAVGPGNDLSRDRVRPRGAVLHLYDPHSALSASLDLCLEALAGRHSGTKFVRSVGAETLLHANEGMGGTATGADWQRKGRDGLPLLLALREGSVVAHSAGLREVQYGGEVEPRAVEQWLERAGVLLTAPPPWDSLCRIRPEEDMLLQSMRRPAGGERGGGGGFGGMMRHMTGDTGRMHEGEEIEEDADHYACGVAGCCKSFFHEHVGVANEAQDGLLVSEAQVGIA